MSWHTDCLRRRLETTRAEIERVAKKDHPGTTARLLFKGLSFIAERLLKRLHGFELEEAESSEKVEDLSNPLTQDIIKLGNVFSHVSRVDSARIPFELVPALAWACSDLLNRNCQVLLRLSDQGYSIIRLEDLLRPRLWHDWDERFLKEFSKQQEKAPSDQHARIDLQDLDIVIVGIPTTDARSILLHALIAHELGHEIYNSVDATKTAAFKAHVERAVKEKFPTAADKPNVVQGVLDSKPTEYLGRRHVGWLCELFADMVAARLLGPPYLAAAGRIFLGADAVASDTHPHVQMRREAVCYYLKHGGKGAYKWTLEHPLFAVAVTAADASQAPIDERYVAAADVCRTCFPQMAALVDQTVTIDVLSDEVKYETAYDHIATAFNHLSPVPPEVHDAHNGSSAMFWLMLSCAWTLRFDETRFGKFKTKFAENGDATESEAEHRLDNLLLHSLRSAEIRHRYKASVTAGVKK